MINDLDQTLAALLQRELPAELAEQLQFSFGAPDDRFPPSWLSLPAINLFLYDVRENLALRSVEVDLERGSDGKAVQTAAPVRVDASYLITAWPNPGANDSAEEEHRLLGEVMRALLRYRTMPQEVLRGGLTEQALPLPVSRRTGAAERRSDYPELGRQAKAGTAACSRAGGLDGGAKGNG